MKTFALPKKGERFAATWDVTISVPVEGGKIEEHKLMPRYRMMKQGEIDVIFDGACERLAETAGESADAYRRFGPLGVFNLDPVAALAFLGKAVTDIDGLKRIGTDGKAQAQSFDDEVLGQLVDLVFVRRALLTGYFEFHAGAREKNSETSSG